MEFFFEPFKYGPDYHRDQTNVVGGSEFAMGRRECKILILCPYIPTVEMCPIPVSESQKCGPQEIFAVGGGRRRKFTKPRH